VSCKLFVAAAAAAGAAAAAAAAHQVKELLAPYGALKSFNLVMDKNTGKSKVRWFLVYNFCWIILMDMADDGGAACVAFT
jgi:hypothetical protein